MVELSNDYCSTVIRTFRSEDIAEVDSLISRFYPPKLVIISKPRCVRVIDVSIESDEGDRSYETSADIVSVFLQQQFLWVVLDSGRLDIYDLLSGSTLAVDIQNYSSFKIKQLMQGDDRLYLLSESEECFVAPFSEKELSMKMSVGGSGSVEVQLSRARPVPTSLHSDENLVPSAVLRLKLEMDNIVSAACPVTGLKALVQFTCYVERVVAWSGGSARLAVQAAGDGERGVLVVRLGRPGVELEADGTRPWALGGAGDALYFLATDHEQRYCLWRVLRSSPLAVACALAGDGHYAAAQQYALDNQLDMDSVLKLKLASLLEAALTAASSDCLPELVSLFNDINDFNCLLDAGVRLCRHDASYGPLLGVIRSRVLPSDDIDISNKLCENISKIELLGLITSRGLNYTDVDVFENTFLKLCALFVSNSDLDLATITWIKYQRLNRTPESEDFVAVLDATPQNVKLNSLMVWLRIFVSPTLEVRPFYKDLLVAWAIDRVFFLERSKYWPEIGIKFIDDIKSVLEDAPLTVAIRPPSVDGLDVLKVHMTNIKELKDKYKINMLIGELSVQSPNEIVMIMLHRCYTEDLSSLMEEYLPRYMVRHGLEHDALLRRHVERQLVAGAVHAARLRTTLAAFYSLPQRLHCLLHVLRALPAPWPPELCAVALEACAHDHPLADQVKTELKYAKLKIVLKKYNFPDNWANYHIVIQNIVKTQFVDLDDLKVVLEATGDYGRYGSLLYVDKCLRSCSVRLALDYFKSLDTSTTNSVLKSIITNYESIINNNFGNSLVERNYIDFLKGTCLVSDVELGNVESLYHLKNSYETRVTLNEFCKEDSRLHYLEQWCERHGPTMPSHVYFQKGGSLARLVGVEREAATQVLVRWLSPGGCQRALRALLARGPTPSLGRVLLNLQLLPTFKHGSNYSELLQYFDMFSDCIASCKEEHLHSSVAALSFLNAIVNSNNFVKNQSTAWKFHYVFMPSSTYSSTNDLIDFYAECLTTESPDTLIANDISSKNDFIPFRVLAGTMESYVRSGSKVSPAYFAAREKVAKKLSSKILLSLHSDDLLITCSLLMLAAPVDWMHEVADARGGDLAPTAGALATYVKAAAVIFDFQDLVHRSSIGPHRALKSKYNLNLADFILPDFNEETSNVKIALFNVLRSNVDMDIACLIELCRAVNIKVNDGLSLQVVALVCNWELNYKVFTDAYGCKQVIVKNDEKLLIDKCCLLVESINSKEFLADLLKELWKNGEVSLYGHQISCNPYFYEAYLCIHRLLGRLAADWRAVKEHLLLHFLKLYQRISSPKQYEFDLTSVKGMFPEIGHYRLPFSMFVGKDMWTNLKSEITLDSYSRWLPVVSILSLDFDSQTAEDMLCSNALKQTMTLQKRSNERWTEKWSLHVTDERLLKRAHECVQHISSMEWASACLFYLVQGARRGADQVAAAELCLHFAQRWAELQPTSKAAHKMQLKYCALSTVHSLHKVHCATDKYLRLSSDPAQLIKALYLDDEYMTKMLEFDVNQVLDEIADKNNVNISSIRQQILESILEEKRKDPHGKALGLERDELIRAKYILRATCPKMGAIYLARIALDDESDFNKRKKLKALQCLVSSVDSDTLLKVSNRKRPVLWDTLLELYFAVQLENIDMPFAVATFMEDKRRALQQIWQTSEKTPACLRVMTQAVVYYWPDADIIEELLQHLVRCDLQDELASLLPRLFLGAAPVRDALRVTWTRFLLAPFERADYPVSERQRHNCLKSINLLPAWPEIDDAYLEAIWRNCLRCKCPEIGCLVLPYMSVESRRKLVDWGAFDKRGLIANIKNLHSESYLAVAVLPVIESLSSGRRGRV